MIQLEHVTKRLKNQVILNNISVNLNEGKCYGIVGYNGCGKTMLLRAICGFMSIDSGEVSVDGKRIGKEQDFLPEAGVIIGETDFLNGRTGFENLKILAEIRNRITDEDILKTMDSVGILHAKDKKVRKYSLGMKQRLRLAQALMEDCRTLILDEPFNALDKEGIHEIQQCLLKAKNKGKTILLTSHDDRNISLLCDRVLEMDNGKIISERENKQYEKIY